MRAFLDTSVFIAHEQNRPLGALPRSVGEQLARLRAALKALGRAMKIMDAWIAATAIAHGAAVCTQEADFEAAQETGLLEVVRV